MRNCIRFNFDNDPANFLAKKHPDLGVWSVHKIQLLMIL